MKIRVSKASKKEIAKRCCVAVFVLVLTVYLQITESESCLGPFYEELCAKENKKSLLALFLVFDAILFAWAASPIYKLLATKSLIRSKN